MKKLYLFLLLLAFMLAFPAPSTKASGMPQLFLTGGGTQITGFEFDVPVNLNPQENRICSFSAPIKFPPNLIEVTSITSNPNSNFSMIMEKSYNNSLGTIKYTAGAPGCSAKSTMLFTIKFKAKQAGSSFISFDKPGLVTVDSGGNPYRLALNSSNTMLSVQSPPTTSPTFALTGGGVQKAGSEFTVPIILNTNNVKTCSFKADFKFSRDNLEAIEIIQGDIYNIVMEKTFSNALGTVKYTAGVPGCSTASTIAYKVKFKVKKEAFVTFNFSTARVTTIDSTGMPYTIPAIKYSTWISPK